MSYISIVVSELADVELDLDALEAEQRQELIDCSHAYGMKRSDFIRLLDADQVLEAELRAAKIQEEEKLQHVRCFCFLFFVKKNRLILGEPSRETKPFIV